MFPGILFGLLEFCRWNWKVAPKTSVTNYQFTLRNISEEQRLQIQIQFMKKLRAYGSLRKTAIIRCRIFCLPIYYIKNKIYRTKILPVVLYGCESLSLTNIEEET